jgi:hypothetical protein
VQLIDYYDHLAIRGDHMGPASLSPSSPRGSDIALYTGVSLFQVVFVGAGYYYTKSDAVVLVYSGGSSRWQDSGLSDFRFCYVVGFTYDIQITDALFVPLGLYYRDSYTTNNVFGPASIKLGA